MPERIFAMNSSVRILLIIREPVTRAISDYAQLRSHALAAYFSSPPQQSGNSSTTPSTTTLGNEIPEFSPPRSAKNLSHPLPQAFRSFEELAIMPDGSVNVAYRPITISVYHLHMLRWIEVFDRRQILIVNGDQLIEDPLPQLKRIESFLGIDPKLTRQNFYFNRTKGFYCMRNDTAEKCLREGKGRKHPKVRPEVVAKLRSFFKVHNKRFYDLVGENFGWPEE